jgi:hypothetical protein
LLEGWAGEARLDKNGKRAIFVARDKIMQTLRKIIDVKRLMPFIDIPADMRQGQVEIIIIPIAKTRAVKPKVNHAALNKAYGSLHQYANPSLIPLEKTAWQTAVAKNAAQGKYGPQPDFA